MNDIDYMTRAYQLALKGRGQTSPNPMVGAIVVKQQKIIAEGWHKRCGGPHAEIIALKKAQHRAQGAKLYVTLEPCFHFGRTSPCVDSIIKNRIKEVVIGMKDPNPLTNGKSIAKLKQLGIKTRVGLLEEKLKKMNESFIKYIKYRKPFVVVKVAQTLDGKIATQTGQSKWITSSLSRRFSHQLRNEFDAIMVGINTVLKDNPGLNASRKTKDLKKIILDSHLRIPPKARLFHRTLLQNCVLATTKKAPRVKIKFFQDRGVQVILCPQKDGLVDLKWLLEELAKREITSVLIEGGSRLIGSALKEKLVDKMLIFIAPKILGDHQALSAVKGRKIFHVNQALSLKDISLKNFSQDLFLEGYIQY